jgi:hypothetical protein
MQARKGLVWSKTITSSILPSLDFFLVSNRFHNSEAIQMFTIIIVYVDDSILLSNNVDLMEDTKKLLRKEFEMSNLRSFHFCLGMETPYDKELGILSINQQRYIEEKTFQRYNM